MATKFKANLQLAVQQHSGRYVEWLRSVQGVTKTSIGDTMVDIDRIFTPVQLTSSSGEGVSPLTALNEIHSFIVIAAKGMGKTTLLKKWATLQSEKFLNSPDKELLPLYLSFAKLRETNSSVEEELESLSGSFFSGVKVEDFLTKGRVMLFLDALDEPNYADMTTRTTTLRNLRRNYQDVRVVVACRTDPWLPEQEFKKTHLHALSFDQINELLRRWLSAFDVLAPRIEELLREFQDKRFLSIRSLLCTPLLAVLYAKEISEAGELPEDEARFIQSALMLLVSDKVSLKGDYLGVSENMQLEILSHLAVKTRGKGELLLSRNEVRDTITNFCHGRGIRPFKKADVLIEHFMAVGVLSEEGETLTFTQEPFAQALIACYALQTGELREMLQASLRLKENGFSKVLNYLMNIAGHGTTLFKLAEVYNDELATRHTIVKDVLNWLDEREAYAPAGGSPALFRLRLILAVVGTHYYATETLEQLRIRCAAKRDIPLFFLQDAFLKVPGRAKTSLQSLIEQLLKIVNRFGEDRFDETLFDFGEPEHFLKFLECLSELLLIPGGQREMLLSDVRTDLKLLAENNNAFVSKTTVDQIRYKVLSALGLPDRLLTFDDETVSGLQHYFEGALAIALGAESKQQISALSTLFQHWNVTKDRSKIPAEIERELIAELPKKAMVNQMFFLEVYVKAQSAGLAKRSDGRPDLLLIVNIVAEGCEPGNLWQVLLMPSACRDSERLRVPLTAKEAGEVLVEVQVFSESNRVGYMVDRVEVVEE